MNWAQTVNTLIFVVGTLAGVYTAIHLANIQKQKMPENMAMRLEQFARMAVQRVEQTGTGISPEGKRALAQTDIIHLYDDYKLPVPSKRTIDTAIESAVFLLPHKNV